MKVNVLRIGADRTYDLTRVSREIDHRGLVVVDESHGSSGGALPRIYVMDTDPIFAWIKGRYQWGILTLHDSVYPLGRYDPPRENNESFAPLTTAGLLSIVSKHQKQDKTPWEPWVKQAFIPLGIAQLVAAILIGLIIVMQGGAPNAQDPTTFHVEEPGQTVERPVAGDDFSP